MKSGSSQVKIFEHRCTQYTEYAAYHMPICCRKRLSNPTFFAL